MFKKLSFLIFIFVLLLSLCALVACDKSECTHKDAYWRTLLEETCTSGGLKELYCPDCRKVLEDMPIEPSHEIRNENSYIQFPTCTEDGYIAYPCSRYGCDFEYIITAEQNKTEGQTDYDLFSHGHTEVIDPAVPPTEYASGLTEGSHCDRCGAILREQQLIPILHKVNITTTPGVSVSGLKDTYEVGEEVTLTAVVENGYRFLGWYGDADYFYSPSLTYTFTYTDDLVIFARSERIQVTDITLGADNILDLDVGTLTFAPAVTPSDAYYAEIVLSLLSGADTTGATLNGNTLTATSDGDVIIRATVKDKNGATLFEKDFTISVYSTYITSLEITNLDKVVYPDAPITLQLMTYPPMAYPRGEYKFQLVSNTCGASISKDGVLSVTGPGSVRIRVKVDDSEWSPYVQFFVPTPISTPEEFLAIKQNLSGYYILTEDIDLSAYPDFSPIGYAENSSAGLSYDNAFKGFFDGNGHKITGLHMNVSKIDYITVGLFGAIDNSAVVRNLTVEDYNIEGISTQTLVYLGGLAGILNGEVSGSDVSGKMNVIGGTYIGGVTGQLFGKLQDTSIRTELVIGNGNPVSIRVGGAVGFFANGTFTGCDVNTSLNIHSAYGLYAGGTVGEAEGNIENVTLGKTNLRAFITNADSYVGLYVGKTTYRLLENIQVEGEITVDAYGSNLYLGAIAGQAVNLKNCSADVTFASKEREGGDIALNIYSPLYFGYIVGYATGNIEDVSVALDEIHIEAQSGLTFGLVAGQCADIRKATVSLGETTILAKDLTFGTLAGKSQNITESTIVKATAPDITVTGTLYFGYGVGYADGNITGIQVNVDETVLTAGDIAYVGGIGGYINGKISNATFKGDICLTANSAHLGGIGGYAYAGVEQATFTGDLYLTAKGTVRLGGIIGKGSDVRSSSAYAIIDFVPTGSANSAYIGGIVGEAYYSIIENAYFFGFLNVSGSQKNDSSLYLGGLVGYADDPITNSVSNATITLNQGKYNTLFVGGIAGYSTDTLSLLKADGDIIIENQGLAYVGGIVGEGSDVLKSYSVGNIQVNAGQNSSVYVGGIAGQSTKTISECYHSFGDIRGVAGDTIYLGGIVGCVSSKGKIQNAYASYTSLVTDMSKIGKSAYIGGIAGEMQSNTQMANCYSMCFIEGMADGSDKKLYVGGIVGYNNGNVTSCYTESAVNEYIREEMTEADIETTALNSALVYAGGLVGYNTNTVMDCYSAGVLLTRNSYTGGFAGYNNSNIQNAISRAEIRTALGEKVGAFTGHSDTGAYYQNCYFSSSLVSTEVGSGTGTSGGITGKSTAELRGTAIYEAYDKTVWEIVNGKYPRLALPSDIWGAHKDFGYRELLNVNNKADQHGYPIPEGYCKVTFDVGAGEYPVNPIYVYKNEGIFLVQTPKRIGYTFVGWYFDKNLTSSASDGIITLSGHATVYAKWEPILYHLTVEADGKGTPSPDAKDFIYLDEITLSTTDIPLDYFFAGWYLGDELLSTEKVYTLTAPANDLHITARYLTYHDLTAEPNNPLYGTVVLDSENGRGMETATYTVRATPKSGYTFFGWFIGDTLVCTESEYTFTMPRADYNLTARFTEAKASVGTNVWDGTVAEGFSGGTGTEADPYLISTGSELAFLASVINGDSHNEYYNKHYRLICSIDLDGREWTPIGYYYSSEDRTFDGHFDGNGHTVSNFKITYASTSRRGFGLFGRVDNATIENLGVTNFTIRLNGSSNTYCGGLVGESYSSVIRNCFATEGTIDISVSNYKHCSLGGLVGEGFSTSIENAHSSVDIKGSTNSYAIRLGAFVGYFTGSIKNCYATGSVTGSSTDDNPLCVGGFAGALSSGASVSACFATGNVTATNRYPENQAYVFAGGFVGSCADTVTLDNCYRYNGQVITVSEGANLPNEKASVITLTELNDRPFYKNTLCWGSNWNAEHLDFLNGIQPSLCIPSTYYQLFITPTIGGSSNFTDAIVHQGSYISLLSTPATGYRFVGWFIGEECIGTSIELTYTPDTSCTIVAKFENIDYTLHAESTYAGLGDVIASGEIFHYQDMVSISAKAVDGYEFLGWFIGDECISTSFDCSFRMSAKDTVVTARYCKYFTLTVDTNSAQFGSAQGSVYTYESALVPVSATPKEGYRLFGWFVGDTLVSTDEEFLFEMPTGDCLLVARFTAHEIEKTVWNGSIATGFSGGTGTADDPYLISTGAELAYLAYTINSDENNTLYNKHYRLLKNIDLGGLEWDPIGCSYSSSVSYSSSKSFWGTFDGDGYTVSNFKITTPTKEYYYYFGLFGQVHGTIKNLSVNNFTIDISTSSSIHAGGLVGYCPGGTITNCYASGNVSVASNAYAYAGGLMGENSSNITNCYASGNVSATSTAYLAYAGGLVGCNRGDITNCYANSNVSATATTRDAYAGGLVGSHAYTYGNLTNCYASGDVSASSSSNAKAGGLVGHYYAGGITNCYRYEGQIITHNGEAIASNSYGVPCTLEEVNRILFYTETLGWDAEVWDLTSLDFINGKLPALAIPKKDAPLYIGVVGETYYQIFIDKNHLNGATGDVNLYEYIVKAGDTLQLIATAGEGFELFGYFHDGKLLTEDAIYLLTPTASMTITAEFDLIRYTFITEADKGLTISDHEKRHYENAEITVTVTVRDGYIFDGWFLGGELVGSELSYTFTMPPETYILVAKATPIDYNLTVSENLPDGGESNLTEKVFHVDDTITLSYTLTDGYRFLGWYLDGELLHSEQNVTLTAPARHMALEAKTELIPYKFETAGTSGGTYTEENTTKTVLDEIHLQATPDKGYDFIGWYIDNEPYSYELTLTMPMPARDLTIEARFKEAFVNVRVVPGFHGSASGSATMPKDSEITLTAIPDEGYRFVGWFLGGELVSTSPVYTAVYDVSGSYAMHAVFDLPGIKVTYYPENKTDTFTERIDDPETYLFPYAYYEGYIFEGWYLDRDTWQIPLTADVEKNTTAYAKWTAKDTLTSMYKDLEPSFTFEMYTRVDINDDNLTNYLKIYDIDGKEINAFVKEGKARGYYDVSANYTEGATYRVEAVSEEVFLTSHMRTVALSFTRAEVLEVDYNAGTFLCTMDDIVAKKPQHLGVTVRSNTALTEGMLLYCIDDPEGVYGYIAQATLLEDGTYDVIFSSKEVNPEDIFSKVNVKQDDLEFDLADAEIVSGDIEEAKEAFAETVAEASSVNLLMRKLAQFAEKNPTFVFDSVPKVETADPIISGKLIEFKVTLTVNGERKNSAGETLDTFAIRLIVTFRNEISTSCDLDLAFPATVKKFEFTLQNTTTIAFNLDLVYGNKEATSNFDTLEQLLKDYKTTIDEEKDPPFDASSAHSDTFEAFELSYSIPLGSTGLFLKLGVTPFLEYELIGQIDINTSFSVINTCTASYIKGDFDVYHNCETNKVIEVYALAYLKMSIGLDAEVKLYFAPLADSLYAKVNLKVGPYVTASGALRYEQHNSNITADLTGFVEWGYFYDIDVSINLIIKEFSPDIERVDVPLGNVGHYYLYFEFALPDEKQEVTSYIVSVDELVDRNVTVYDLAERIDKTLVSDKDEYTYSVNDNPYVYINAYGQLVLKQAPSVPTTIYLSVSIGPKTNRVTKTVALTINVQEYDVVLDAPKVGVLQADKSVAIEGETVSFIYSVDNATYLANREFMVVSGWLVNGEYIATSSNRLSVKMQKGGLDVQVVTRRLTDVYEISKAEDLNLMRTHTTATFVQTADIDLGGIAFAPIGTTENYFQGVYYGCGYTIHNLHLSIAYFGYGDARFATAGLFNVAQNAKIHDMHLENVSFSANGMPVQDGEEVRVRIGAIMGHAVNCELYRCTVDNFKVDVHHEAFIGGRMLSTWIGGLVGYSQQSIVFDGCSAKNLDIRSYVKTMTLKSWIPLLDDHGGERNIVGGLIGESYHSVSITNCYTQGSIHLSNSWLGNSLLFGGGLAGIIRNIDGGHLARVENCLTDIAFDDTRSDKKLYSAVANIGDQASSLKVDEVSKNLYFVNETYTIQDNSGFDTQAKGYAKSEIYTEEFIRFQLDFDPLYFSVRDGELIFIQ